MPLLAVLGLVLVAFPFQRKAKDETLSANTRKFGRAKSHLQEADRCLAETLAGLRVVSTAEEKLVIFGDRRQALRRIQQITKLREQLHQLCQDADACVSKTLLPRDQPYRR